MASWFTGGLFLASLLPVVKLVLMCVCGALAARKGILDAKGRRYVNLTVFWIFTPALIFVTLGGVFSFTNLKRLWMIPVNILMSYPIGLTAGWILCQLLRCPKQLRTHVILAVAMGNTGNMPFLFVMALCNDSRTPFPASLGDNCQTVGYGYVALGVWVAAIFQFALAFSLLKPSPVHPGLMAAERSEELPEDGNNPTAAAEALPSPIARASAPPAVGRVSSPPLQIAVQESLQARRGAESINGREAGRTGMQREVQSGGEDAEDDRWTVVGPEKEDAQDDVYPMEESKSALWKEHGDEGTSSSGSPSTLSEDLQKHPLPANGGPDTDESPQRSPRAMLRWLRGAKPSQKNYGSIAATLGISEDKGVVRSPPRQQAAVQDPGLTSKQRWEAWATGVRRRAVIEFRDFDWTSFYTPPLVGCYIAFFVGAIPAIRHLFFGNSRALGFVTDTLDILGTAMIPAAMLVIGAVLQNGPGGKAVVPYRILLGVVLTRLFIIPILGTAIIYGMAKQGAFYIPDPLYFFLLLLMYLMPTSYNLQTMATLHKNGEREMGAMIFWVYICGMFTMPFFIMYFLHLSAAYA